MADYNHLKHLKINKVREGQLDSHDGNNIDFFCSIWPEKGVSYPTVGWIFRLGSEQYSQLHDLLQDVEDEETVGVGIEQLDEFIKAENKRQRIERLTAKPADRAKLIQDNLKVVLDWLRLEPYSTPEIMALVLRKSEPSARRILNKFRDEGWLVRDEVKWTGSTRKKHMFGISSQGLYHLLDDGAIEPPPSRDFRRGQAKPATGEHILNNQLARLYFQRKNNPEGIFREYRAARDLPFYRTKIKAEEKYMWWTYPDARIEKSHLVNNSGQSLTIAVEIEQHSKGSKRYKELIKKHRMNINNDDRYDHVIYLLGSTVLRDNFERLFHRVMDSIFTKDEAGVAKNQFSFDTYDDLPERIRALG